MHEPTVDQSTMHLIIDQLEELVVTIIDEVRQRPAVAVAILAGVAGALAGSMLATRFSNRHASPPARVVHKARGVGEANIVPPPAAIANAIYRAAGVRMSRLPMNPAAVMEAIWNKHVGSHG